MEKIGNLPAIFLLIICRCTGLYGELNVKINSKNTINCWTCRSPESLQACSDPFQSTDVNVWPVPCTTGCFTKKSKAPDANVIAERGCNEAGPVPDPGCTYSLVQGTYQSICYCNSDKCNSARTNLYDPSIPAPTPEQHRSTVPNSATSQTFVPLVFKVIHGVGLLRVLVQRFTAVL